MTAANVLTRRRSGAVSYLTGGAGEPFLLLHGIPGSAHTWQRVGAILAERYRVIIPDLPGFGSSDMPRGDYYMADQARELRDLIARLGIERLYIGAHDFGGPVALTLIANYPELSLRGLALAATNLFTDTYIPPPLRVASVPMIGTLFFKAMVGNRIGSRILHRAGTRNREAFQWERFREHLSPSAMTLTRKIFQRSLADLPGNYRHVEERLGIVDVPTLVLWGDHDPFFAVAVGERTQRRIRGSRLKVYRDTGHFVPEERADDVARDLLEFFR